MSWRRLLDSEIAALIGTCVDIERRCGCVVARLVDGPEPREVVA
ncbi:hypothetical protein [Phenylobacterium sp.]|jgi:hypothetical protein